MPPNLQLLGIVHIIWSLGQQPRLLVNFVFLPIVGSNEAPTREASARSVDMYVASVRDRLRSTLQEAQAQSTAEACQQKVYYDRKIGAVNLTPGDLVLVKADAWKGKRKIKDMWEEDLGGGASNCSLCSLLQSDKPTQTVMSPPPKLTSHHIRGWCSLVYGQPSYMGQVTSPTPCKTTSVRGDEKRMPQEKSGKVVTRWPTSKASLGWTNGNLWLIPWMSTGASIEDGWKTTGKVIWLQTSEGTCM